MDEGVARVRTETERGNAPFAYYDRRREFLRHLRGDGIEIGALYNPLDLSGLPITRVRYVDRLSLDELRAQYPEHGDLPFVPVDIVDDGETLATIPDAALDFIIANNMIEHCANPLGTLRAWLAKLRVGGVIYLTLPDQRVGWDEHRPLTTIAHLVEDYRSDTATRKGRDAAHFAEWYDLINRAYVVGDDHPAEQAGAGDLPADLVAARRRAAIARLIEIDYSIHYHVFTHRSFRALLDHGRRELHFPLTVVDAAPPVVESWECIFVLRRVADGDHTGDGDDRREGAAEILSPERLRLEEMEVALARSAIMQMTWQARLAREMTRAYEAEKALIAANARLAELPEAASCVPRETERAAHTAALEARLRTLEGDIIAKNRALADFERYISRIEASPPFRVARAAKGALRRLRHW
jgi:SAM-dependent methyltransferase